MGATPASAIGRCHCDATYTAAALADHVAINLEAIQKLLRVRMLTEMTGDWPVAFTPWCGPQGLP